uniref:MINDY deubiquitinase domain-containing protein n=1 Tax=Heterosigma akashiwo TaxID=2829 RepID=A0A7S4D6C0_HETAK
MIEDLKLKNENQNHLEREVEPQKSDDDHINNKKMTNDAVNDTQSSAGMMDGFIQNPALIPDTQLGEKEKRNSSGGLIEVPGIDDILMHQQDGSQTTPLSRRMPSQRTQDLVDGAIIDRFMNNTSSQLTYFGLSELHGQLRERQFCVFFRNNHFCTLFKNEEKLYLLVTDLGYQHEYDVVWERFDEIDGDTEYVNGNFRKIQRRVEDTPGSLPEHIVDPDYLMAMQLQQGEDADVGGQARPPPEQARTADGTEISPPLLIEDDDAALAARLHQEELAAAGAQGGAGQAAAALQQQPPPPAVTAAAAAADPSYPTREDGTPYSEAEVQAMIQQQLAYAQRRQQGGGGGGVATAAGGRSAGPYRPSAARNSRKKKDCTVQ